MLSFLPTMAASADKMRRDVAAVFAPRPRGSIFGCHLLSKVPRASQISSDEGRAVRVLIRYRITPVVPMTVRG
jgi:hypothetical protein